MVELKYLPLLATGRFGDIDRYLPLVIFIV